MTPMLQARQVSKTYPGGVEALRQVDLQVAAGQTLGLIGESGSGKSTLLRLFNRMEEATAGTILVDGRSIAEQDPIELRRRTGYVPQDGGLLPHWTVARNIALVPGLLGWPEDRTRARVAELMQLVGLDPAVYRGRYPIELSGGQRQRVAFARALAGDPPVVLLDEPFGALDPLIRAELQQEFARLQQALRKTMVLVTHDLAEAFLLADQVAILRDGVLLQVGDAATVRNQPADDYVRALVEHAG